MSEFILSPKKSRRNKPTIKVDDEIETIHGKITVREYGNNSNVLVFFAEESVKPNPQWHTVAWIRRNEIKPEKSNGL